MAFIDEARSHLRGRLPDLGAELKQYVPRVLVKDGVSSQDAWYARHLPQLQQPSELQVLQDVQIATQPRIVVIGDAGSGKSFVVRKAFLESARSFLSVPDTPVPCFLDLGQDLIADRGIEVALDLAHNGLFGRIAAEHRPGCVLFLDSLDDKLWGELHPSEFVNALALFIRDYAACLISVVVACRRSFWNPSWFQSLEPAFQVFHADHLDSEDYVHILPDQPCREAFFLCAESLGVADLLKSPFIGFDLARSYQRGEVLPSSRREWFERQIHKLLTGQAQDRERAGTPSLDDLLSLGQQLACIATWSHRSSWTVADAVDQLGQASTLRDRRQVTWDSLTILFQRPLFTKRNDRFSFSHQLLCEHLAAKALERLSLRKQKQLLTSSMPGLNVRILTPLRGVAVALAEASTSFGEFLVNADPVVAFPAELPMFTAEYNEQLLKAVIDDAIASNRAYWWPIPPRGERFDQAFHKHRVRNSASFLQPYLESSDQTARLWATACVKAWGGVPELNDVLLGLAHDPGQHVAIRTNAIEAVLASQSAEDVRTLYGLRASREGQVRGYALIAYRTIESPRPREFIGWLCAVAYDDISSSLARSEWWAYIKEHIHDPEELDEAFRAIDELYERFGNLRPLLLESLYRRAIEIGFDNVPASLLIKTWEDGRDFRTHTYHHNLRQLLSTSPALFARVWSYALDTLAQDDRRLSLWAPSELDAFAEACSDEVFGLLPFNADALNWGQRQFIKGILARYFCREPKMERLREFRRLAPAYTQRLRIPEPALVQTGRDRLEEAEIIARALNREGVTATQRACLVISALGQILDGHEGISWLEPDKVIPFLHQLRPVLLYRVMNVFYKCISEMTYPRIAGEKPNSFRQTTSVYAVSFWLLWHMGLRERITAEKLDEFIRCYAFSSTPSGSEIQAYFPLLDRLQELSCQRWKECILWLAEFSPFCLHGTLEYLAQKRSSLYVERCRQRLLSCEFTKGEFNPLLEYWQALNPPDFEQVMHQYYRCLGLEQDSEHARSQQFRVLWVLLSRDDDWAWEELGRRVDAGSAPTEVSWPGILGSQPLPRSSARLCTLVRWFVHVRKAHPQAEDHPEDLGQRLLQAIIEIGGEGAVQALERLRREQPFPGAEWLSQSIIQIQDNLLMGSGKDMPPGQLLDFINQEVMGIIRDERDLFESVCQATEDEKESLERGEQVGGYWRGDEPQSEPVCQNILWPAVKRRLYNLGIVGVEEKHVGRKKVDLWVVKVNESNQQLQTFLELKVARENYGRPKLIEPLYTQLWYRYLRRANKRFGVYIVLWFRDENRYPYPQEWQTMEQFEQELRGRCNALEKKHDLHLACYVVNMTAPIRQR